MQNLFSGKIYSVKRKVSTLATSASMRVLKEYISSVCNKLNAYVMLAVSRISAFLEFLIPSRIVNATFSKSDSSVELNNRIKF